MNQTMLAAEINSPTISSENDANTDKENTPPLSMILTEAQIEEMVEEK